jgi:hypothetical protein
MTLSVWRLHEVDDRMVNEYGTVGGMIIGMGNKSTRRILSPVPRTKVWRLGHVCMSMTYDIRG